MPGVRVSRNISTGIYTIVEFVLTCGINFFTSLYMHPMEHENALTLIRKKDEAELDMAINTVARSISKLDGTITSLKDAVNSSRGEKRCLLLRNELESMETQRSDLRYLLGALRGRIDACRLMGAVQTLAENVGLQLNASAYINRQVSSLAIQRDLDDARHPVTKVTVRDAYSEYSGDCTLHVV